MTRWQVFRELRSAMRDPNRLGDVAAYKSELGGSRARPEVEAQLDPVRDYRPPVDLDALEQLPAGTLGREYARFLKVNGLDPFLLSDQVPADIVARNALVIRYGIIHDMVHVLTGFDSSWPGEVGVWAFVGGQYYSRGLQMASLTALLVAPFMSPLRLGQAFRAFRRGWAMGKAAKLLITERLEEEFETPLETLRARLDIEGARDEYVAAEALTA